MTNGERIQKAKDLFHAGFNCAQSVTAAFADEYGMTEEQALKVSASFGGGIGRMRETCGAACGMFILAGLETGSTKAGDREGKNYNYKVVQELASEFVKRNGSLICGVLLGLKPDDKLSPESQPRTTEFYKKRPCEKMVEEAARIWIDFKEKRKSEAKNPTSTAEAEE